MLIDRRTVLATGAATLAASAGRARAAETAELVFWSFRQEDKPFYLKAIDAFHKANPDVSVRFETFEPTQFPTILSTALAGGKGPDIIQARAYGNIATIASYLMPLPASAVPEVAHIAPAALTAESVDGTLYAIPYATSAMLIIMNTEVMDKAGVAIPRSWDEMMTACAALKGKGVTPFANGTATAWQNETLTFALLGSLIGKSFCDDVVAGKVDFTDPRFVGALAKLQAMGPYLSPNFSGVDYVSSQQLFVAGRAAMFAGGSFELANFRAQNPKLKLDVFAAPGATSNDPRYVSVYYDGGYAANAKTAQRDAAIRFLRYTATPAYGTAYSNALQTVSPIDGVSIDDSLTAKVAQLDKTAIPYLMLVYFRYKEPSGSVLLQSGVQKMMAGHATPAEVGADITKGLATYTPAFRK